KQREAPEVSFLDFLALTHYDQSDRAVEAIDLVAERLQEIPLTFRTRHGNVQHFFLPAFRTEEQLLRMPIRPEDLSRTPGKTWCVSDYLVALGKALEVDAVLVDLRAGLSELAGPVLFDPRVMRVVLTTISHQSEEGARLTLKQIRKLTPIPQANNTFGR
ncbi:ParA family protein, partial [bacterium]|nr:ParA family protein [bacterium]